MGIVLIRHWKLLSTLADGVVHRTATVSETPAADHRSDAAVAARNPPETAGAPRH